MLDIIKSQINYIASSNIYSIILMHVAIILYSYFRGFNPSSLICFFLFTQYAGLAVLSNSKENRDYSFALLSISNKDIALSKILLTFLGYITIYSIALILHIVFFRNTFGFSGSLQELLLFGGLALCGIFFYISAADYFSIIQSKAGYFWFNIIISLIIAFLAFGAIISVENSYSPSAESSNVLIGIIYFFSIIFAAISYFTYQQRESYLGYK